MKNKQNHLTQVSLIGMEFFLFFLIILGAAVQVVFGQEHALFHALRAIYVPGLVLLAGIYASKGRKGVRPLLYRAVVYALLFVFFGLCNQVLLNHKKPFQSLARLVMLTRIPTPSEIFFTATVLFLCAALAAAYYERIAPKKRLTALLCILALFFVYFPADVFGYPVIGVFTGCETYDCVALLPYLFYFMTGLFWSGGSIKFSKKLLLSSLILSGVSAILLLTPLRGLALVTGSTFPVYAIGLFCAYCAPYRWLAAFIVKTCKKIFAWLRRLFRDFSENKRNVLPLYFVIYTVMFLVMAACVFFSFIEYDNSITWNHDAISQYIPRIHYFIGHIRTCISQIFEGNFNFPSYSFRSGLGNSVALSYEPVYWLFMLFNPSDVEGAYNFILIFRFFLAGLSASVFFLYHRRGYFESLLGSMMYTFCGFAIYAGVLHAHFIAPMIFLPLLLIATEEIFRKKRWYLCTIFVAVALPANYYFIYMSTIAMGIYYVGRFLFTKDPAKKNWKYFFTTTCTFAGSYLLGVVIGNISLFTSFASYMSSGRTGSTEIAAMSFFYYNNSWLARLFTYFISTPATPGAWLKLGFIPLSYIAIVVLLMKKDNKLLKFLFLTAITFCIFPIAAYVMGGFSTITNRWCYILALLVSYITVWALPQLRELTKRELKILFIALLPYVFIILVNRDYRTEYTLTSLAILLCNYVVVLCMNREIRLINKHTARLALITLCCGALTLNGYYQYLYGKNTVEDSFVKQGEVLDEITDTPMKALADYPDDSFYRVSTADIPRKNLCASLIMDYNSIATFSSTISGPIINYNAELGNTAWNLVQLGGFDNRTFMNALACVKYYSLKDSQTARLPYGYKEVEKKETGGELYHIYENQYALPLGYTYDSVISEEELANYSALEKQEVMLKSAVLEDASEAGSLEKSAPSTSLEEAAITDYETKGIKIEGNQVEIEKEGATLTLWFDGRPDSETYLVFDGELNPTETNDECIVEAKLTCGAYKRGCSVRSSNHTYGTGQESFVFNMGYRKESASSCTITFKKTGTFTLDSLKVVCQPMKDYASYISGLKENSLENVTIDGNTITGTISADKEKLLVLSIPYQKGWTAYLDGEKVDIKKANLMYSALSVGEGDHEIKLVFERPGIKASLALSAFGIAIFIAALIIRRKRIKIKKQENEIV